MILRVWILLRYVRVKIWSLGKFCEFKVIKSSHRFGNGVFVNLHANHASYPIAFVNPYVSIFGYDGNDEPMNDARTIVNAQIGYDWGPARVWLNIDYLLDESYVARVVDVNSNQLVLGAPKHFTVNFEANF